jgi:hypothetical protein
MRLTVPGSSGSLAIGSAVTSGTSGSVLFIDGSGNLGQDNANLFWDDTNNRLGIGTASPAAHLEIMSLSAANIGLIIQGAASQSGDLTQWQDSSGNSLLEINSNGTINYAASSFTLTGNIVFFNTTATLTSGAALMTFFQAAGTSTFTNTPGFTVGPTFFQFSQAVKATTNNLSMTTPIGYVYGPTCTADGVVWTGSDIFAAFVESPTFSVANSGSYATFPHTGYKSSMVINTGAAIASRRSIRIVNATGAGTLTDQIGLDVESLTKGSTSNIAIRTGVGGVIEIGNKISKYNNIATVSNGVPSELATVDLADQSAAIGATTIYSPTATGLFRISIYLQVTRAATTSSILGGATGVVITYNDGDGNVSQSNTAALATAAGAIAVTSAGNTTATNLEGTMVIYARTGVAIQYAIGYTSVGVTTMQFAAHLKVEAL